ncbi:MAG: hypothetical protein U5K79_19020 [Cyclobacteriaceae bacterium]|nr:hypothetical protein [Cyclobacteriaceae bacterium]
MIITCGAIARAETFDLTTYTPPDGWENETRENFVSYTKTDEVKRTWCSIYAYTSTALTLDISQKLKLIDKIIGR